MSKTCWRLPGFSVDGHRRAKTLMNMMWRIFWIGYKGAERTQHFLQALHTLSVGGQKGNTKHANRLSRPLQHNSFLLRRDIGSHTHRTSYSKQHYHLTRARNIYKYWSTWTFTAFGITSWSWRHLDGLQHRHHCHGNHTVNEHNHDRNLAFFKMLQTK